MVQSALLGRLLVKSPTVIRRLAHQVLLVISRRQMTRLTYNMVKTELNEKETRNAIAEHSNLR